MLRLLVVVMIWWFVGVVRFVLLVCVVRLMMKDEQQESDRQGSYILLEVSDLVDVTCIRRRHHFYRL